MHVPPMLALRSVLLLDALDETALDAATTSAADAVAIDLAGLALHGRRREARRVALRHAQAIAQAKRPVLARVSDTRSGELEADVEALTGEWLAAVMLPGAEAPQDARDADVQIRMHEMRRGLPPGGIRLVPEVDSAEALLALPRMLASVDRHSAVALDIAGLLDDLGAVERAQVLIEHTMAQVAIAAHATGVPWLVIPPRTSGGTLLVGSAHEAGAIGAVVAGEAAVRGMNALFAPAPAAVEAARAAVTAWDRRPNGTPLVRVEVRGETVVVDRRSISRSRRLVALADAIARQERVTSAR